MKNSWKLIHPSCKTIKLLNGLTKILQNGQNVGQVFENDQEMSHFNFRALYFSDCFEICEFGQNEFSDFCEFDKSESSEFNEFGEFIEFIEFVNLVNSLYLWIWWIHWNLWIWWIHWICDFGEIIEFVNLANLANSLN